METERNLICENCHGNGVNNTLYLIRIDKLETVCCIRCVLRNPRVLMRSVKIALLVGTILFVLNQGDIVLGGHLPIALTWKIPLTYVTPFVVSLWGALATARR